MAKVTGGFEWRHVPEACAEDLGDLRKVSELSFCARRRRLTFEARRDQTSSLRQGAPRGGGGGGQMEKSTQKDCVSLSICQITFNSKIIKSFVPELRSRKCFFCVSGFLCYLYMSCEHSMYISHIRIMGMLQNVRC